MPSYSSTVPCVRVSQGFPTEEKGKKVGAPVRCLPRRPDCFGLVPFSAEYMLACKNSTETKCVPRLWRVGYEAFFWRSLLQGYSRRKKKSSLWHMKIFASRAWFPHSLVFWQWGWTRQSCWSSLPVQPVLHKRAKVTMEGWAGTLWLMQ